MIPHPRLTIEAILKQLADGSNRPPEKVNEPTTPEERALAHEALLRIVADGGVRFHCGGCDNAVDATEAAVCTCGAFICPACRRVEEEGVCNHERPAFLPAPEDDDE